MTSPTAAHPEKRQRVGNGPHTVNSGENNSTAVNPPELDRIISSNTQLAYLQAQLAATEALCSAYEDELDALAKHLVNTKSSFLRSGQSLWKEAPQPATDIVLRKQRLESGTPAEGEDEDNDDADTFTDIEEEVLLLDTPEPAQAARTTAIQQPAQQAAVADEERRGGGPPSDEGAAAAAPDADMTVEASAPGAPGSSEQQQQQGHQEQQQQQQQQQEQEQGPDETAPGPASGASDVAAAGLQPVMGSEEGPGPGGEDSSASAAAAARARLETLETTCSAVAQEDMEAQGAVACLCGRTGKYYLRSTVVTLGRCTETKGDVDVDLTPEEGPPRSRPADAAAAAPAMAAGPGGAPGAGEAQALQGAGGSAGPSGGAGGSGHRISRRQALVRLGPDGQFRLVNMGRQPVLVNDVMVEQHYTVTLPHLSLVEIAGVRLLFMANLAAVGRVVRRSAALVL